MAEASGWQYYKGALLPACPPDVLTDTSLVESGQIWRGAYKNALFARWTSEFDCGYETQWWYVIKDEPFDIGALNAKKRYKVNRGLRFFEVKRIDPVCYVEDIYRIQVDAYADYPEKYRPVVDREKLRSKIETEWTQPEVLVFGAFHRETERLEGYIQMTVNGRCIHSNAQKATPACEKFQINYALLAGVLEDLKDQLNSGYYISVGSRNIQHETAFQNFVEDIFGFRKAYCRLNVAYNPRIAWGVGLLYGFRGLLGKLDHIGIVHKINGVLKMEEIIRAQSRR